jgi:hypothetical protein
VLFLVEFLKSASAAAKRKKKQSTNQTGET